MTSKNTNLYDQILRWVITVLVAVITFYSQRFVNAVDKLNETVTILSTEQKHNEKQLIELCNSDKQQNDRIIILEQKTNKQ